jgi:hypothetical protein
MDRTVMRQAGVRVTRKRPDRFTGSRPPKPHAPIRIALHRRIRIWEENKLTWPPVSESNALGRRRAFLLLTC